jgi:hypothetical protein
MAAHVAIDTRSFVDPRVLRIRSIPIVPQRTREWKRLRKKGGNSSAFLTYLNVYGDRLEALLETNKEDPPDDGLSTGQSDTNLAMSWGTLFEEVAGQIFTYLTGYSYEETGSLPHPMYPRVRGSVDGYISITFGDRGLDDTPLVDKTTDDTPLVDKPLLIVLETKVPLKRRPSEHLDKVGYLYQILQNIEIIDADFALFNDYRLLPITSDGVIHDPNDGEKEFVYYERYNLAKSASGRVCKTVLVMIERKDDTGKTDVIPSDYMSRNLCDLLVINTELFSALFTSGLYKAGKCLLLEEEAIEIVGNIDKLLDPSIMTERSVGYMTLAVSTVNIERIERNTEFWTSYLLPIALSWVAAVDKLENEGKIDPYLGSRISFPRGVDLHMMTSCPSRGRNHVGWSKEET